MYIIKAAGALCVFCVCVYIGFSKSIYMRRREEYLLNIKSFLNMLDVQIQFSSDRLERCMRRADKHTHLGRLLSYTVEHMRDDGIQRAWSDSVRLNTPYLTAADREILSSLGAQLGMTDRESQYKNICCTMALIDKQYEEARQLRERTARLYEGSGIAAGALAVILLV